MKGILQRFVKSRRRLAVARIWGKLATAQSNSHDFPMRRLAALAPIVILAACAPRVHGPAPVSKPVIEQSTSVLIGLTAHDLGVRFGQPSFQVREGVGTKLQWSENGCVLDAYLYPPESGRGVERVMHADSRSPSGADLPIDSCLALMSR